MSVSSIVAFFLVSGLCLALSNVMLMLGDSAGYPLPVSIVTTYVLVVAVGYPLHCLFSFRRPLSIAGLRRYAIAMSFNIPLAFATVWLWRDLLGLPMLCAAPLATGSTTAINFVLSRWAISGRFESSTKPWIKH